MKSIWRSAHPLFEIFWSFCKLSPLSFGGGYAMIPMIEKEVVENRHWIGKEEMPDVLAVSGSAPGAVGVNTAVYIGYRLNGVGGSAAALLGMVLPTFVITFLLYGLVVYFQDNASAQAVLKGIGSGIVALILFSGFRIGKQAVKDFNTLAIAAISFAALFFFSVNPILLIAVGVGLGILCSAITMKKRGLPKKIFPMKNEYEKGHMFGDGI